MANIPKVDGIHTITLKNVEFKNKITRILDSIGKFALDSTFISSLKGVNPNGKKEIHKIIEEELKEQTPKFCSNDKARLGDLQLAEDVQDVMEKREENLAKVKHEHTNSVVSTKGSAAFEKMPNGGFKGSEDISNKEKRIFIRSRL